MGIYNSDASLWTHVAKHPGLAALSGCNLPSFSAVTYEAQRGLTVNWPGNKSRSFKGMNRCSEKAGECQSLTTIETV